MNRLELRTEARRLMFEQTAAKSTAQDPDLNKWINEALINMSIHGKVYQRSIPITVTNGISAYPTPWDFLGAVTVNTGTGVSLDLIQPEAASRTFKVSGKPVSYYLVQSLINSVVRGNLAPYTLGTMLVPASANGFMYEVTTYGTTGAAPPTYPTDEGQIVTDGTCVLTCREYVTQIWYINLVDTPTTAGGGTGVYTLIYNALCQGIANDPDSPPFPVDRHHIIPVFVCFKWAEASRQANDALNFAREYAALLGIDSSILTGSSSAIGGKE